MRDMKLWGFLFWAMLVGSALLVRADEFSDLVAQQKSLDKERDLARVQFRKTAMPSLPEYKVAKLRFDECDIKVKEARDTKAGNAAIDAAIKDKLAAQTEMRKVVAL